MQASTVLLLLGPDQGVSFGFAIHEALAFGPLDGRNHTFPVRHLSHVPPEIELTAVPVKMLLAELAEDAIVTTLQQGEVALGRVRVKAISMFPRSRILPSAMLSCPRSR